MFPAAMFPKAMFPGAMFPPPDNVAAPAVKSFSLSPNTITATGAASITATGVNTTWGVSNPFSIISGPANNLTSYVNTDADTASFSITVTALTGAIVIRDSDSGATFVIFTTAPAFGGGGFANKRGHVRYWSSGASADPAFVDSSYYVTKPVYYLTDLTTVYFEGNGQEANGPSAGVGIPSRMVKSGQLFSHTINSSDTEVWGGFRTECTMVDPTGVTQYAIPYRTPLIWGAAFKLVSFQTGGGDFLVSQWHNGDSDMINPSMSLCVLSDRWTLVRRWDPNATTTNPSPFEAHDIGPVVSGVFEYFALEVSFDWNLSGSGYTRLHRNGQIVVDVNGPNSANDVRQKFHKHGFYQWNPPGFTGGVTTRQMLSTGDFFYLASSGVTPQSMLSWLRQITG